MLDFRYFHGKEIEEVINPSSRDSKEKVLFSFRELQQLFGTGESRKEAGVDQVWRPFLQVFYFIP